MDAKILVFCLLLIFGVFSLCFSLQAEASEGRLALKISGGLGYVGAGDINDYLLSLSDAVRTEGQNVKNFHYLHLGYEAEAEIIYHLSSRWMIGLCSGLVQIGRTPNRLVQNYGTSEESATYHTLVSLIPIEARIYFRVLSSPKNLLYIHAGIGYDFSHWYNKKDYQYETFSPPYEYRTAWKENAGTSGFAFRFGIGYEQKSLADYPLWPRATRGWPNWQVIKVKKPY